MAYIDCPSCGKRALSLATRCPHCGLIFTTQQIQRDFPEPRGRGVMWALGVAVLALAVVGGMLWVENQAAPGGAPTVATAEPLADDEAGEGTGEGLEPVGAAAADTATPARVDPSSRPARTVRPTPRTPPPAEPEPVPAEPAPTPQPVDTAPPIQVAAPPARQPDPPPRAVAPDTTPPPAQQTPVAQPPAVATPTPAPQPTPAVSTGLLRRYAKTWVNMRSSRSGSSAEVRVLNPGEAVMVDSLSRGWYRVVLNGQTEGYVAAMYLEDESAGEP